MVAVAPPQNMGDSDDWSLSSVLFCDSLNSIRWDRDLVGPFPGVDYEKNYRVAD